MPYTSDPQGTPSDLVRAYVGDVDNSAPLLDDGTYIAFLAVTHNNAGRAAVLAATAIAAHFAREPDRAADSLRISYAPSARSYTELARILKSDPTIGGFVAPLAGGITDPVSGNDLVPFFTRTTP